MPVILVVDDEPLQRDILKTILDGEGYETYAAASGEEALELIKKFHPDIILTDLRMEGMDGIEFMESVPEEPFQPSVIIITAHGTISSAVEAVKKGAFDYLTKPLDKDTIFLTVRRGLERVNLLKENLHLQRELYDKFKIEGIVGKSDRMQRAMEIVKKVAPSGATVLIRGESGTGKELVARAIHYNSNRRTRHFTALNCAAIPENLVESELFGYEPGAFTGATSRKEGLFELTNGGTLFLDEIGDLPLPLQSKLLRVLQDKEIRRIGGKDSIKIDVRIIAATNKDLEKEVAEGKFREDIYYRLKVVTIALPPLRERSADIPELVNFFMKKYNEEFGKRIRAIEPAAMKALVEYNWPGNIRQMESVIERAVLLNDTGTINMKDIQGELEILQPGGRASAFDIPPEGLDLEKMENELIRKAMERAGGVATKAAKLLGMSYKAFLYRLEKSNINGSSESPSKKNGHD
ncbi:MAG: sigma-54-dependent Fis family transcriptional regulator [Nitrospiraceae bacterium]|nr:MAG: sigma-54-dependent Fis family transcriptional regulator [Nitrospiraceae bacterium]